VLRLMLSISAVLLCVPGLVHAQGRAAELPPGEGRELVQKVCSSCHTLVPVMMKRDGVNGWRHTVGRMVLQRQAQLTPAEFEIAVRYLSTALGPGTGQMQTGTLPPGAMGGGATTAKEVKLPDGPGRQLVEGRCASCHDLGRVVSIRRTKAEWESLTRNMTGRGPQITPEQVQAITDYLTANFLEKAE
jgi:mono/diheme cytochrome c family protein